MSSEVMRWTGTNTRVAVDADTADVMFVFQGAAAPFMRDALSSMEQAR
jgi:hypothetical protein